MSPSVEAFDEAKYKALMGGLECSEIKLSQVREYKPLRIDSHFFEKKYRKLKEVLSPYSCLSLKELVLKDIQTGHTPSMSVDSYYGGCIALIKTDNLHENSIGSVFSDYLTSEGNAVIARTQLAPRDIITTIIGATERIIARSAIIMEEYLPANINQNIVQIRIDTEKISPEYVITYLNTKYGKGYLVYLSRQTEQFNLNCKEVESVLVPILSNCFQNRIEEIAQTAQQLQSTSRLAYKQAEAILSSYLNFNIEEQERPVKAIKNFKCSFASTGRLDAEYYQPKYDALFDSLAHFNCKTLGGDGGIVRIKKSIEPGSEAYQEEGVPFVRVSDVDRYEISTTDVFLDHNIVPDIESLYPKKDTILFSKDGSVGIAYKVEEDGQFVTSGALLHLIVRDTKEVLPDYLTLVLNSPIVQMQAERDSNGAIIQHWKPSEIEQVVIPVLDMPTQEIIAAKVQESFALRRKSKELLEYAKQAVEMAIEKGEEEAIAWLNDKTGIAE